MSFRLSKNSTHIHHYQYLVQTTNQRILGSHRMITRFTAGVTILCCSLQFAPVDALLISNNRNRQSFVPVVRIEDELGISPTLKVLLNGVFSADGRAINDDDAFFFDPLYLATDDNFSQMREAELKHGRVSMLAIVGVLVENRDAIQNLIQEGTLSSSMSKLCCWERITFDQIAQVVLVCAFLETKVFIQQDALDMPGDYATGYFGSRNKALNERSLLCELENGRLAMVGIMALLLSEFFTGKGFLEHWEWLAIQTQR